MNISYRWVRELVPGLELSAQQMADALAMLGAPVDEVVDIGAPLRDVIIGRIERTEPHPNADRLSLCAVDDGSGGTRQVVCGAPNVKAGAFYPFARVGAVLPGGITLRRAKIRGVESEGMLCSARELGLGRDHEGILELHGEFEPGAPFVEAVGIDDTRLVVDVTPNRPDLLSHVGIAREIAAATGLRVRLAPPPGVQAPSPLRPDGVSATAAAAGVEIRIEDADLCSDYIGIVIRGVRVGPSPEWLASRLRAIGQRPISNVVDATNWVLHELGQPLHAFDLPRLGTEVRIRRARADERITTLDGVERRLVAGMLVIADAERPVAVAGVMGGADTEVQDDTRDVLLECALFDPKSVRTTRRALNLSSDASYRFERGVDPDGLRAAAERAAAIIVAVAGGVIEGAAWARTAQRPVTTVRLRLARVEQVLGEPFTAARVRELLAPLGFDAAGSGDGAIELQVPGHRSYDVAREEDLIEEVARRHGYDAFADELRPFRPSTVPSHPLFALEDRLRTLLVGHGLLEAHTAAFAPEADGDVPLMMPLAATESRLRNALLPGLLRRVEYNFARGARSIRLFEIGTAFTGLIGSGLPRESTRLALVLSGYRRPLHWSETEPPAFDVWDLKGLATELTRQLGLGLAEMAEHPLLEAGLSFRLLAGHNGETLGVAGRVRDAAVDAPAWAEPVWGLEVELHEEMPPPHGRYATLPAHPAIERDFALLVPDSLSAGRVLDAVRQHGGPLLETVEPFDVYSGAGVPEGTRSVAVRLRFRAADRTLTDREVDDAVRRLLRRLNDDLGVQQRA